MTDFTTVSPGSNTALGGGAAQRDLYLKKFSGEVLATFNTKVCAKNYIRIRNVSGQKSAQFPAIGRATASYHQPGEEIDGQTVAHGEVVLNIDDLLVSPVFVSNFLEAMTHFETRGEYARQMGDSLAQIYDQKVFALATKACVDGDTGPIAGFGAATRDALGASPAIADIVDAMYDAQKTLDERDIPESDRVAFVTPEVYYAMVNDGRVLNRDYGNGGSQSGANLPQVAGLTLIKTNNLNKDWSNGGTDDLATVRAGAAITDFDVDASTSKVLIMHRQAIGAVHLMDMSTEAEYSARHQGTLLLAKMANGMGVLRPECLHLLDGAA